MRAGGGSSRRGRGAFPRLFSSPGGGLLGLPAGTGADRSPPKQGFDSHPANAPVSGRARLHGEPAPPRPGGHSRIPEPPGTDSCARSNSARGARSTHLPVRLGERLIGPTAITADCFPSKRCQREAATRRQPPPKGAPVRLARCPSHPAIKACTALFSPPSREEAGGWRPPCLRRQARVAASGTKRLVLHPYRKEFYSDCREQCERAPRKVSLNRERFASKGPTKRFRFNYGEEMAT